MEMEKQKEWSESQKITFSVDLVDAARKMMKFLTVVDRNRELYDGPALHKAIYRYNACWLPLLAKHAESPLTKEPLVVPLDCEWVWHVHRLNPIRYKLDCEKLFGRVLGNKNVISTVDQTTSKVETEKIWKKMYPEESFELDMSKPFSGDLLKSSQNEKFTDYNLVAAVKRQTSFANEILVRPFAFDELFLQEALARYKGFLHLIQIKGKNGLKVFGVPTFDIDLMWHAHQLSADSYNKDMKEIMGKVLQHNDDIADKGKGSRMEKGAFETTKHWEDTFGLRYWKAGGMNTGSPPAPVTDVPVLLSAKGMSFNTSENCGKPIEFPMVKTTEIYLEFAEIKNVPEVYKGNLMVLFSKKQSDKLLKTNKLSLTILSEAKSKQVGCFQCEATGEFLFELVTENSLKQLGSCSLSLQKLIASKSQLMVDKWLQLDIDSDMIKTSDPILLHVYISFTPPTLTPQVLHLVDESQPLPKGKHACKIEKHVRDCDGNEVFTLQMRNMEDDATKGKDELLKEVYYITKSGEKQVLAKFLKDTWYVIGSDGTLKLEHNADDNIKDGHHLFQLVGHKMVKLFSGRRLEFEAKLGERKRLEDGLMTAVEFSVEYPYGKAIALIDLNSQSIKATEEWIVQPGIVLTFILSQMLKGKERKHSTKGVYDSQVLVKTDGVDNQCIGQCGNCGDNNDVLKTDNKGGKCHSTCIGPCLTLYEEVVKSGGIGNQCIGQCGNCGDNNDIVVVKTDDEGDNPI